MFEVVGVDLPIRVSLTSGAGVTDVFSDIEGADWVVIFVLFNNIVSDCRTTLRKYWFNDNTLLFWYCLI